MRIYVPLHQPDLDILGADRAVPSRLRLDEGRPVWAVTAEARADRADEDVEDLEYEAMQDAIYATLELGPRRARGTERVAVVAGDVSDGSLAASSGDLGAFGATMARVEDLRIASLHVSELGAERIRADDVDPALLWFDVAETSSALDYLGMPSA